MTKPTIICVLGMHRSGTSLVAQLLHALDLDLGPEAHLMGSSEDNPAGHWENEPIADLNDEILDRLGGTWWEPPEMPPGWERDSELADLRRKARKLIDEDFAGRERWGFKDPRTCLTLPLWQSVLPPMRYVTCLRNPVDVAWSLKARRSEPVQFEQGAELWLTYMRSALAGTAGEPQLILSYEDLMADPKPVVRRLGRFIGNRKSAAGKAYARAALRVACRPGLWHHQTPLANVIDEPRLPFEVKALYLALRLFAVGARRVDPEVLDLFSAHAMVTGHQRADIETRIAERRVDLERSVKARIEEQRRREEVEAELEASGAHLMRLREELGRLIKSRAEEQRRREEVEAELEASGADLMRLREELGRLIKSRAEEQRRRHALETQLAAAAAEVTRLKAPLQDPPSGAGTPPGSRGRQDRSDGGDLDEVRARAQELIPSEATVLVASKGDDKLLALDGRRGWHFPAGPDGRYVGYHPAGDTAAIAHLEAMRSRGADHLLVPSTTLWWLDHYQGLRRHLEERYAPLLQDEHCAIYRLRSPGPEAAPRWNNALNRTMALLRIRSGRNPSVLDWHTELGIADQLPETPVFVPPGSGKALPYLDASVDVVVLASTDAARLAEAHRVATSAVINVDPGSSGAAELQWLGATPAGWGEDVGVALIPDSTDQSWRSTVTAFAETLNDGFAGDLMVVGARPVLEAANQGAARAGAQLRAIEAEGSFAQRARTAVETGRHSVLVFVAAPALPLPDWLPSMLALFARYPRAGIVGTRILSPLGALEEAGGILAADGARRRRGEGDVNPDRPEYCFVKRVEFCSRPLLATTRRLFERLKGFDGGAPGSVDALADFSLRAFQSDARVYYQPGARVVRIGQGEQ